jgi:hypothetical protein
MTDESNVLNLFKEYHQKIEDFLKFDELNLKDSQMTLASVRHYWVGRLMFHKQQIALLKKAKNKASRVIKQKLEGDSPTSLSPKTITESISSHDTIQKIDEEIANHELLVEYLTKVESNLRDAQYGMNNLVKIIALETT